MLLQKASLPLLHAFARALIKAAEQQLVHGHQEPAAPATSPKLQAALALDFLEAYQRHDRVTALNSQIYGESAPALMDAALPVAELIIAAQQQLQQQEPFQMTKLQGPQTLMPARTDIGRRYLPLLLYTLDLGYMASRDVFEQLTSETPEVAQLAVISQRPIRSSAVVDKASRGTYSLQMRQTLASLLQRAKTGSPAEVSTHLRLRLVADLAVASRAPLPVELLDPCGPLSLLDITAAAGGLSTMVRPVDSVVHALFALLLDSPTDWSQQELASAESSTNLLSAIQTLALDLQSASAGGGSGGTAGVTGFKPSAPTGGSGASAGNNSSSTISGSTKSQPLLPTPGMATAGQDSMAMDYDDDFLAPGAAGEQSNAVGASAGGGGLAIAASQSGGKSAAALLLLPPVLPLPGRMMVIRILRAVVQRYPAAVAPYFCSTLAPVLEGHTHYTWPEFFRRGYDVVFAEAAELLRTVISNYLVQCNGKTNGWSWAQALHPFLSLVTHASEDFQPQLLPTLLESVLRTLGCACHCEPATVMPLLTAHLADLEAMAAELSSTNGYELVQALIQGLPPVLELGPEDVETGGAGSALQTVTLTCKADGWRWRSLATGQELTALESGELLKALHSVLLQCTAQPAFVDQLSADWGALFHHPLAEVRRTAYELVALRLSRQPAAVTMVFSDYQHALKSPR